MAKRKSITLDNLNVGEMFEVVGCPHLTGRVLRKGPMGVTIQGTKEVQVEIKNDEGETTAAFSRKVKEMWGGTTSVYKMEDV